MSTKVKSILERWIDGEIYFGNERIEVPADRNIEEVTKVDWETIPKPEQLEISSLQKDHFEEMCNQTLVKWQNSLLTNLSNSRTPRTLLTQEIKRLEIILFSSPPQKLKSLGFVSIDNLVFNFNDIITIQQYAKAHIQNGVLSNCEFVLSEKFPFQQKDFIPNEVYAESCFRLLEHIQSGLTAKTTSEEPTKESPYDKLPHLKRLFIDKRDFDFFKYLTDNFVRPANQYADYSFIYYEFKHKGFIQDVTGKTYLELISKEPFEVELICSYEKLKIAYHSSQNILKRYAFIKTQYNSNKPL
jgi:hypothetical protein